MASQNAMVELLSFDGCPNRDAVRSMLEKVMLARGLEPASLVLVNVEARDADRWRFPGSPTIRINGRDVEPGFREPTEYSLSCRVYETEDGLRGMPDRQWIERAIDESVGRVRNG